MEEAERVGEAVAEQKRHLGALLVGEAGVLSVRLRVLEVYLLMSHVKVAAHDDGLLAVELLEMVEESIFPGHAVVEAA